jgi:2,5-furandicarboxylate decarboxylase 1
MSLRGFMRQAEKQKEVLHVKDRVSTRFQIAYTIRQLDCEGPILCFDNVKDFETSVIANVSGTRKRVCSALGVDHESLYKKMIEAWRCPVRPKIFETATVKNCIEKDIDLSKIPVLTHFEGDAGPYITSAVVHARSVDGTVENVSVHRLEVLDKKRLAIRLVPRHLSNLFQMAKKEGKDLDVAISVGVHPAVLLAASSPLPFGVCEYDVANAMLNGDLKLIECERVNASAVAEAELVLEGRISATKEVEEGPFVDITGTCDVQRKQPVVDVVGVMHRENYVYHALLSSGMEHLILMGLPHEALIWEAVSKVVPKVYGVNLSKGGSGWLHAVISVEKQVEGDGKNALLAAFAAHPSLKHAVVVDSDIDVFDASEVEWAVATRFQGSEDLVVVENVRGSTLDPSADQERVLTSKVGFDATRPFSKPKERFERARIPFDQGLEKLVHRLKKM